MMGMEISRRTFTYDEFGNKSEEVSYREGAFESKAIFAREYDDRGNWTKELISSASSWTRSSASLGHGKPFVQLPMPIEHAFGCTRKFVVGDGTAGHMHGRREAELRVPT